jgi:hypothetical protein
MTAIETEDIITPHKVVAGLLWLTILKTIPISNPADKRKNDVPVIFNALISNLLLGLFGFFLIRIIILAIPMPEITSTKTIGTKTKQTKCFILNTQYHGYYPFKNVVEDCKQTQPETAVVELFSEYVILDYIYVNITK